MRRHAPVVVALLAGLVAGGFLLNSSTADEPKPRGQLYPNWRKLGLSDDQVKQIYKIQSNYNSKIEKLEEEIKAFKKQERSEAEKVLTAAQKARLKEILLGDTDPPKDKPATDKKPTDKPAPPKDK